MPPVPLKPLWELRAVAASAPAAVRVRNLTTTVTGPHDAWQSSGRAQPASISVTVTFRDEFDTSASSDSVASDTVHYGQMSKAIIAALGRPSPPLLPTKAKHLSTTIAAGPTPPTRHTLLSECGLGNLLRGVWLCLTGLDVDGSSAGQQDRREEEEGAAQRGERAFLKLKGVRTIEVQVHLPKASLSGGGVTAKQMAEFSERGDMVARATALRIPTLTAMSLIGVNKHERTARQMVVGSLEVDQVRSFDHMDRHQAIARELFEIMSNSSFETLEALAKHISETLSVMIDELDLALDDSSLGEDEKSNCRLHISLEKPIAIPMADAACVELNVWTRQVAAAARILQAANAEQDKGTR